MKNLFAKSLFSALGVFAYVLVVALIMTHANQWFGTSDNFWTPVVVLMLLVLSVAVVGILIFGKPVLMYLDGMKKEAWTLLLYTIGWLAVIVVVALVLLATVFRSTAIY
ncbi:MAG: hypothetical protein M1275_01695 [Patescibacteria group bacterium]|nr:hypothetical protein [Patescibacteria group bacterium]